MYGMAAGYHSPVAVSVHARPSAKACVIQKHKYWRLRGSRIDETNPRNGAKGSNPSAVVSGSDGNAFAGKSIEIVTPLFWYKGILL